MKILRKKNLVFRSTESLAALLPRRVPLLVFSAIITFCCHAIAHAQSPVDRLIESAKEGSITQEQFADSLLAMAEVDHAAIERPEVLLLRFPGFVEVLGPKLKKRVVQLVEAGNNDAVRQLTNLADRMFGTQSIYTREIKRLVSLQEKYDALVSRGSIDMAMSFQAELSSEEEKELFLPKVKTFMAGAIARQADRTAPFQGLKNLMQLGKVSQPPELVSGVRDLLELLVEEAEKGAVDWSQSSLEDPQVEVFLSRLEQKDPQSKELLTKLYVLKSEQLARAASYDEAKAAFEEVLARRPASPENTVLRKKLLFALSGEAGRPWAEALIQELLKEEALSFGEKRRLYSAGYYAQGAGLAIVAGIFGLFFLSGLGLFVLGKFIPELSPDQLYAKWQEWRHERMVKKSEKRGVGYMKVVEREDQYTSLLREFGLDESATDADIKKAYRRLVKEHHPDAHGAAGRVVDDEGNEDRSFEELKRNYKRLMEMRSSFFGRQ